MASASSSLSDPTEYQWKAVYGGFGTENTMSGDLWLPHEHGHGVIRSAAFTYPVNYPVGLANKCYRVRPFTVSAWCPRRRLSPLYADTSVMPAAFKRSLIITLT